MVRPIAVLSAGLALTSVAFAQAAPQNPATSQFNVTITIAKQCTVTAPSTINLGTVGANDLITTATSATQSFTVTCSTGTGYKVGFSSTNDLVAGGAVHQMKGAISGNAAAVQYNLFDVTGSATNAAALSASTSVISDTGTGTIQTKTLKAQVVNYTSAVMPDTYSDTVTLSVTY